VNELVDEFSHVKLMFHQRLEEVVEEGMEDASPDR